MRVWDNTARRRSASASAGAANTREIHTSGSAPHPMTTNAFQSVEKCVSSHQQHRPGCQCLSWMVAAWSSSRRKAALCARLQSTASNLAAATALLQNRVQRLGGTTKSVHRALI
eukprot:6003029-Amphidinium_carterae.1